MRRVLRSGYTDFGGIRIPALPGNHVLTDRADGTLWMLQHDVTGGWISITDTWPSRYFEYRVYEPYNGPVFQGHPTIQLLVRDGYLGYEVTPLDSMIQDMDNTRLLTRRGNSQTLRELVVPDDWVDGEVLAWETEID